MFLLLEVLGPGITEWDTGDHSLHPSVRTAGTLCNEELLAIHPNLVLFYHQGTLLKLKWNTLKIEMEHS